MKLYNQQLQSLTQPSQASCPIQIFQPLCLPASPFHTFYQSPSAIRTLCAMSLKQLFTIVSGFIELTSTCQNYLQNFTKLHTELYHVLFLHQSLGKLKDLTPFFFGLQLFVFYKVKVLRRTFLWTSRIIIYTWTQSFKLEQIIL